MANKFWVGDNGNINDSSHWSASSGGAGGAGAPSNTDNAIFDGNSFSTTGKTVTINIDQDCLNFDWSAVTNAPTLLFATNKAMHVYGDLIVPAGVTVTPSDLTNPLQNQIQMLSAAAQNINCQTTMRCLVDCYGAGPFTLQNNYVGSCLKLEEFYTPTFDANNKNVTLSWFECMGGTLYMGSGTWSFVNGYGASGVNQTHLKFKAAHITINVSTSTIEIHGNGELFDPGYPTDYPGDLTFHNFHIISTTGVTTGYFDLYTLSGGFTVNDLTIDPDCTVKMFFQSPYATVNGTFTANGSAGHVIFLGPHFPGNQWYMNLNTTSISYVNAVYAYALTGTLPIDDTVGGEDGGNNFNWLFSPRYWVGGTGNWTDTSHWSASSGGSGGATLPGTCTNVFFDGNSFSGSGQVATIQSYTANARKIDWSGVTNNPTWSFDSSIGYTSASVFMAADLILSANMTVQSIDPSHNYPDITIRATLPGTYHLDTKGVHIPVEIDLQFAGDWVLDSDLYCFGVRLQNSGQSGFAALTFTTNDHNVTVGFFQMNTSYNLYPCELNAGDSIFTMGPTRSYADQGFGVYDKDTIINWTSGFTLNYTYPAAALNMWFSADIFLYTQAVNAVNFLGVSNAANPYVLEPEFSDSDPTIDSLTALPGAGLNFYGNPDDPTVANWNITHFHVHGEDGNLISMFQDPSGPSYQFYINSDDADVSFIDVQSCIANGATLPYLDTGGVDSGFNTNWSFPPAPPPHPGAAWLEWFYLRNEYYPIGNAYAPDNSIFATTDDLQFFVLLMDNSYTMTKNTYYGFEPRNIITSFNLTPNFAIYKKIKNCIEDVFNTYNGVDFAIQVNINSDTNIMYRVFDVYYPKQGIDNTALNFTYPGNIKKFDLPIDGKTMMNEAIMRGQGSGINQLVDIQRGYNSIFSYGARQDVEQMPDVDDENILTKDGQEYIRVRQNPMSLPSITLDGNKLPYLGSYNIGDQIRIQITNVPSPVNAVYRIEQIHVKISDDDQEEIDLSLSLA